MRTLQDTELGINMGIAIGGSILNMDNVAIHLKTSIFHPGVQVEITLDYGGGLGSLRDLVPGQDAVVFFTGGPSFSIAHEIPLSLTKVHLPESNAANLRSTVGLVTLNLVSRWVYQETSLPDKIYQDVTDPNNTFMSELKDIGLDGAVGSYERMQEFAEPRNIFRLGGARKCIETHILPWAGNASNSPYFWYSRYDSSINLETFPHMLSQPIRATLVPAFVNYSYDIVGEAYAFDSRSYKADSTKTHIREVNSGHYKEGELSTFEPPTVLDHLGVVAQKARDLGEDSITAWYPGYRPEEDIRAHAAYLRRDQLAHQVHVLLFKDLDACTVADAGSRVRIYDFDIYMPEQDAEGINPEELVESNMSGDYIVAASHYYYDSINDDGVIGSKLEVIRAGYPKDSLSDVPDVNAYIEV